VFVVFSCFGAAESLRASFVDLSGQFMVLKHVLKDLSMEAYEAEDNLKVSLGMFEPQKHVHVSHLEDCLHECLCFWQTVGVLLPKVSQRCNCGGLATLDDLEVQELSHLSFEQVQELRKALNTLYDLVCSCRVFVK